METEITRFSEGHANVCASVPQVTRIWQFSPVGQSRARAEQKLAAEVIPFIV